MKASIYVGREPDGYPNALRQRLMDERDGLIQTIALPWVELNHGIGNGFAPGNVTVVAGPPGAAKSYFILNLLLAAGVQGVRWRLLPLEDDAQTWILKCLAVREGSWRVVARPEAGDATGRQELGEYKLNVFEEHHDLVSHLYSRVAENPRLPLELLGNTVVLDVRYQEVLSSSRPRRGNADWWSSTRCRR